MGELILARSLRGNLFQKFNELIRTQGRLIKYL